MITSFELWTLYQLQNAFHYQSGTPFNKQHVRKHESTSPPIVETIITFNYISIATPTKLPCCTKPLKITLNLTVKQSEAAILLYNIKRFVAVLMFP